MARLDRLILKDKFKNQAIIPKISFKIIMKIDLKYFTGTGNSLKILSTCKEVFIENNHSVNIAAIKAGEQIESEADILGFCFPVYAFGIPRICRNYLNGLSRFDATRKVFVLITAGAFDESGFSVNECSKILISKNCEIIYSGVVEMPINWTVSMNPPSKQEARTIIDNGVKETKQIASDILNGVRKYHEFNIPKRFGRFGLYKEYWLFKLGVKNLWKMFRIYDTCNACQLCEKICPTGSIKMTDNKPVWTSTCEQCMRCVNFCPNKSIYQSFGGDTTGRNRYYEPSFKPLKESDIS
jgi:ferredoxin